MAVELNITTFRHVPFGGTTGDGDLPILGEDYSDATFEMHIRLAPGATGDPLIELENAAALSEGISAEYDADYPHPLTGEEVGATVIRIEIDETSIESLPVAAEPEEPAVFYYDLQMTPSFSGARKRVVIYGTFTVYPGVTNA